MKYTYGTVIIHTTLAALVIFLILIPMGYAAIKVKEGDWAKYRIELHIPEEIGESTGYEVFEKMEWVKVEVQSVSDTSISLKMTVHYKNGTEDTDTMPGTGFIVDTDLAEGDEVSTPLFGPQTPLDITGLKQQTYAGASREVYYVDFEQEEMGMSIDLEAYWDKETGILCETAMSMSGEFQGETISMSVLIKMTETNMWEAGLLSEQGFLILAFVAIAAIVVIGSAIVLMRRRKAAPLPDVAPTPTE